jgi:uncharacterized membrane protein
MSNLTAGLVIAAALGSALTAGVFFAFSTFVMAALARLPAAQGISAMQHINVTVINPWFMGVFIGTGALCIAAAVSALTGRHAAYVLLLIAAAVLYLAGSIGVTSGYHQPRNLALVRLDPSSREATGRWARYQQEWVPWNHVRTIACVAAAVLLMTALWVD